MKFTPTIRMFIEAMQDEGLLRTPKGEHSYRHVLFLHGDDVDGRDPRQTTREDVLKTLKRWPNPNTRRTRRAVLVSFYDFLMEEGLRKDNPARQTRKIRKRPADVYRMTLDETVRFVKAAQYGRERWIAYLGVLAGLRLGELVGLQGRHLRRPGFIWVSADIAKGGKERWIPLTPELAPIAEEIAAKVADNHYVFSAQRWRNPGVNTQKLELAEKAGDDNVIWRTVKKIKARAGIAGNVTPHTMRHAFAEHIARGTGVDLARMALGHADLSSTQIYLGQPTLDELALAMQTRRLGLDSPALRTLQGGLLENTSENPLVGATGIEPVDAGSRLPMRDSAEEWFSDVFAFAHGRIDFYRTALGAS